MRIRSFLSLAAVVLAPICGCAGLYGRAAAPDEQGSDRPASDALARPPPRNGPSVVVHVDSPQAATLVRLDDDNRIVEDCPSPCDVALPLDATYRIDGPAIRSSWPFRLASPPDRHVTVTVAPEQRSSYATAKLLGGAGGGAMVVGLGLMLGGLLAATSAHDENGGSPAECPGCRVAAVGGATLGLVGVALTLTGVVMGISTMSSGTTQTVGAARGASF